MIINNEKFKGIIPALLTPFDENDKVNMAALTELVHYNIAIFSCSVIFAVNAHFKSFGVAPYNCDRSF